MAVPSPSRRRSRPQPNGHVRRGLCVIVADHQAIDRKGMVSLLERQPDVSMVVEASTLEDAIKLCRAIRPDVLVLAVALSPAGGGAPVAQVRAHVPDVKILAVSERGVSNCVVLNPPGRRRLRAEDRIAPCAGGIDCLTLAASQGALGTLRRSADPNDLYLAVRAVGSGTAWYEPGTATALLVAQACAPRMSDRELDVAALVAEGHSNKEIALTLKISEPTVKKHVGRILEKFGLEDRLQMGLMFARNPLTLKRGVAPGAGN
jgi:DNA-binding NarL/FixJ family response regulator